MECNKIVGDDYHIDHIVPVSRGGDEWSLDNLEQLCPQCNLKKGTRGGRMDRASDSES